MISPPLAELPSQRAASGTGELDTVVSLSSASHRVPVDAMTGRPLSRYVILGELGRGGMGRVLRAYDPKLQREVALKEVHWESLGEETSRRLIVEARAMAKLSHPNVVAIHDVDEAAPGRAVMVMEYVAGKTLGEWLAQAPRDWQTVVAYFIAAGRGLLAAHEAGVLHRDFKPANVLVTDDGVVKVTDFGVAKLTTDPSSSDTSVDAGSRDDLALTRAGTVMGTPRYMAPEQHSDDPLTPAADQYAFCLALWEALCGAPPFGRGHGSLDELLRLKHGGPPAWPAPAVPSTIARAVTRGLAADPRLRWPSMRALLDELAWSPARQRKRRRLAVSTLGALSLAGVAAHFREPSGPPPCSGAAEHLRGTWDDARREQVRAAIVDIDRAYATAVSQRVAQALDGYAEAWTAMHTEACEATSVRMDQSFEVMDLRMACLQRAAVELRAVVDELASADAEVVAKAHELTATLPSLSRCADVDRLRQAVEPPEPDEAAAVESIRELLARSRTAWEVGRYEAAQAALRAATEALGRVSYAPAHIEAAMLQARAASHLGEDEAALQSLERALELSTRLRQWEGMADATAEAAHLLGEGLKRADEGLVYARLARGLAGDDELRQARVLEAVAAIRYGRNDFEGAVEDRRRVLAQLQHVLGPEHPAIAAALDALATALHASGRHAEAEAQQRDAIALRERLLGPEHPDVARSINGLGIVLYSQGHYAEAEVEYRRALASMVQSLGPEHPETTATIGNRALVLTELGRHAEAEAEHRRALELRIQTLGPDHPFLAASYNNLANSLMAAGRLAEAAAEHRRAITSYERALGRDHPDLAGPHTNLANALILQGQREAAEPELRRALEIRLAALGPDHRLVASSRERLAALLLELGRPHEALELAEQTPVEPRP